MIEEGWKEYGVGAEVISMVVEKPLTFRWNLLEFLVKMFLFLTLKILRVMSQFRRNYTKGEKFAIMKRKIRIFLCQ